MSSPHFSFLSFFLSSLSLVRPRRRLSPAPTAVLSQAGARKVSQGWPRLFGGHPQGLAFTELSTTAGLFGRVDYSLFVIYLYPSCRALFRSRMCFRPGLATRSMARAIIASTYIRQLRSGLPRCCLHGQSRRRDGAHLSNGRLASANLRCVPTATHPTCPTHPTGVGRNSAHCRRYRVRVAPCGTRPCSR
jgi:hypothetical protein